jgi:PAS domain S-box-containing protein
MTPAPLPEGLGIDELRARLAEAEETLDAIRNGEVDAVVVGGPAGQQVYTLENADRPYRVLIEQMQEGALTLSEEGTLLYCNDRLARLLGASRAALLGAPFHPYLESGEHAAFDLLLGSAAGGSAEFTLLTVQGRPVPVNLSLVGLTVEHGMPQVICGVVTDLSNNRRRSHELAAANARLASEIEERRHAEDSLQLALDAAGMGSWDIDLETGVARRSLRLDQIFGHPQRLATWQPETLSQMFLPEDREAVSAAFAQAERTGSIDFERRVKRASDGEERWVHVRGRTYYQEGRPVRIAGVVSDVTERRQIEEQLRQAQKMEAVGQLTGGVAHDFNNLLMVIGGSLDLLSRRVQVDEKTAKLFHAARQGVDRGSKLNQQLLAFARRQDLRSEAVNVAELIPTFQHLLDRALTATISVKVETEIDPWFCETDPHQLETAILNLAINARDAMPGGGVLTLATQHKQVDGRIAAAHGVQPGDFLVVSVGDTGSGMPAEVASRAFEPFFTTKEVGKGTGLGLSQVYGFARQSNGFVQIDSKLERGTHVRIYLPRTEAPQAAPDALPAEATQMRGRGIVLVVEDDADVRATTSGLLQDLGYIVREAETGRAALVLLDGGVKVDLVFTDVIMPGGISGIDLARELRERRPDLPVLLTSGYTAQQLIPDALAAGLRVVRKPYAQADLALAIQQAMQPGRDASAP